MSAPQPEPGIIGEQWQLFVQGWQNLNPTSQQNYNNGLKYTLLPLGYQQNVSIPGWQQMLVAPTGLQPTASQWQTYYAALKSGQVPNLDPGTVMAIQQQIHQQNQMVGQAGGPTAGSWGKMINAIDNVQDIWATLSLSGHLAIWAAPRLFGRALPVVGTALLISDLLNLLTWLGQLGSVLYGLICNGRPGLLAAGIPATLFGLGRKGAVWRGAAGSPKGRLGMFRGVIPRFSRYSGIALALQLPQATSTVFGWGISLGGIVGVITQGAAAALLGQKGAPINVQWSTPAAQLNRVVNAPLGDDPAVELWLLARAAATMATVPTMLRAPEVVSAEQYAFGLASLLEASRVVYRRLHGYPWQAIIDDAADTPLEILAWPTPDAEPIYAARGLRRGDPLPWDLPGNPTVARPAAWVEAAAPDITAGVERYCAWHRNDPFGIFAGTVLNQLAEESWAQLADEEKPIRWELDPDWALLAGHAELGRIPAVREPHQALMTWWQAARAEHARRPIGRWTTRDAEQLMERHGVVWIRLLSPDAAWPAGWAEWAAANPHPHASRIT